jgi:ABC-type oligopeptide transport system substrate-binding subunit
VPTPRDQDPTPFPPARRGRAAAAAGLALLLVAITAVPAAVVSAPRTPDRSATQRPEQAKTTATVAGSPPSSWDPARQGDAATASTLTQVYEGLTAFDDQARIQPALASSWSVEEDGRRIVFQLRPDLRFSDGSELTAEDVVDSWLRLVEPGARSPLASLLEEVTGAVAYRRGEVGPEQVGLRAEGDRVVVELDRPAAYFPAVTASVTLAVLPSGIGDAHDTPDLPNDFVGSGAYIPTRQGLTTIRLEANPHYWAGPPPLESIDLVTDLEGRSPVQAFEDGELDLTQISSFDASWIRFDATLGPQLRNTVLFSVSYYGFDATRPPFDDARVRRAFAQAVDWDRLVRLGSGEAVPATSLVPTGIVGRSDVDVSPSHDPEAAQRALAEAGYPEGAGFPEVTAVNVDEAVVAELEKVLGVELRQEAMPFDQYFERLEEEPPQFWTLTWIADYPAPHDFLGLLARSGSSNNYSGWSDPAYDAALDAAAQTADPDEQARLYLEAERILQAEAPLVPLAYGSDWSLSAEGLAGANESGLGLVRFASLEWQE